MEGHVKKILFTLIFVSFSSFASFCQYTESYLSTGWTIHDPSTFFTHANFVKNTIKTGLNDETVVFDISGPILTDDTVDGGEILLDAMMFDNLKTPNDEMFGDYAILESVGSTRELVEVRWYDGNTRNIVFNPKFIKCMSEAAPYVDNSVL